MLSTEKAVLTKEVSIAIKGQRRQSFLLMTYWLEYSIQERNLALLPKIQSGVKPHSVFTRRMSSS